jgi:hypothetical protein
LKRSQRAGPFERHSKMFVTDAKNDDLHKQSTGHWTGLARWCIFKPKNPI